MSDDFEYIETKEVIPDGTGTSVYQQDKASVDIQIATARRYPRNEPACIEKAISRSTLNKEIAEKCTYSLKKGGKTITGPSVHLARILGQSLGNMRAENRVVGFDDSHVTVEAICFDLENNYAVRTTIKKSIVGSNGKYSEDMQVITANAANAIAFRNAVFAVVGKEIIDHVYKKVQEFIIGDTSSKDKFDAKRTDCINWLKKTYKQKGLTQAEILKAVNVDKLEDMGAQEIITLIGFEKSITSGEMQFESVFRPQNQRPPIAEEDKTVERLKKLMDNAKTRKDLEEFKQHCTSSRLLEYYDALYEKLP